MKRPGRTETTERAQRLHRLGDVLRDLLALSGIGQKRRRQELERLWTEVAGELSAWTRVGRQSRGTLEVLVQDSVLLHELQAFRAAELTERMRAASKGRIRQIRFRLA